ncbi:carbohydrate kinase family protein [Parasphaerochaeta coccoides]|uniref:Fructokinase n=1 Tax=Parasphaerochaeta coccoides (strain ATCC BAA-1237 / DSM 17374 / SPN1) TaxID=760011 RepID=F4GIN6_PARC1|nr:carbohydrate kinase [Parasphaerochaeta coccoides]AEC02170.1 Fructokinase [Parasphaerochaeta coccoides DSM 17374]
MIGVIGEALIDFIGIPSNEGQRGKAFISHVGGCGLNAATAAARLGCGVTFFGKISSDMFGRRILDHLVENTILFDPSLCSSTLPTLLGFASLDEHGAAQYAFYARGTATVSLMSDELLESLAQNADVKVLHIGSVSMQLKPICDTTLDVVSFLNPRPVIFLDPNARPSLIEDKKAWVKRMEDAARLSDFIKLSEEDLEYMYPGLSEAETLSRLRDTTRAHIILTRGGKGSTWFASDGHRYDQEAPQVKVVDTIGAGDTFSGSLLYFLEKGGYFGKDGEKAHLEPLDGDVIRAALAFAAKAAGITCSREGCDPPTLEDMQ